MNNTEHPKHEPIEEGIEEEISDLPEISYSRGNWSSQTAHTLLVWQRSVPRRSWRIAGGLATLCLGVLALLVILSSLRAISLPSSATHIPQPIFLPRHAVSYPRYTYRTQPSAIYRGHVGPALNVAWSPDGRMVASGGRDSSVQVWNTQNGKRLLVYQGHSNEVLGIAWSPDSRRIASASRDSTVQVWDAKTGKHLFAYQGHTDVITSVAWSPDGSRIASAGYDTTIQVWAASSGKRLLLYQGHTDAVYGVAWSPDGSRIASSGDDGTVQVWDSVTGSHVFTLLTEADGVAWSPDGTQLASSGLDGMVKVWQVR